MSSKPGSHAPSGFFGFRTPLLPFDQFERWGAGLEAPAALGEPERLEQALAADRSRLRERLRELLMRPEIREAVYLASPDFDDALAEWYRDPDGEPGKRAEHALVRYFTRMATRPTPFGLFAGSSIGKLGQETHLVTEGSDRYARHSRLDMDYLLGLTDALAADPALRERLTYVPNSSLYRSHGRARYIETRLDGKTRTYQLVAVDDTRTLGSVLELAADGIGAGPLAQALVSPGQPAARIEEYIRQLIDAQVLVPEIAPILTGPEPIHCLIEQLQSKPETARLLASARDQLAALDTAGLGAPIERYRSIAAALETLPAKAERHRLFQVDLVKPAPAATLGAAIIEEIKCGVEVLHRMARRHRDTALTRFAAAFRTRFELREIPLVEALDDDVGIGFGRADGPGADPSPLLKDAAFPVERSDSTPWGDAENWLLRKLAEALESGAQEIVLQDPDLEALRSADPPPLPKALSVTAAVAAASEEAARAGHFRLLLIGPYGPSGAQVLGRFCHADHQLHQAVAAHLRAEEAQEPDAVFAEIVHLPEGHLGNVLARPVLRQYEIPYLGRSGAPRGHQLPVNDLLVSVRGDRILLRSARLGREVIPRLTTAHNFGRSSLVVYRFLCSLGHQGVAAALRWDWGALGTAPFLPRVRYGRLVLSQASWRIPVDDLKRLSQTSGADRYRAVQQWRARRRLPRLVQLMDSDQSLTVDLDNLLSIESFVHLVKARPEVVLQELFPGSDELIARGPEGRFIHELVVPFVRMQRETVTPEAAAAPSAIIARPSRRTFPPGSEWLYAKFYTGAATADPVLRELVQPLVEEATGSGAADCWFFLRYGDPDWHLRLRLRGDPDRLCAEILPRLRSATQPFLADGRVSRLQLDTYEREVERYGGPKGIELAEQFFHRDSEAVLDIVERLDPGDAGADQRWQLALKGMHQLLDDLGFDLPARHALASQARDSYLAEFKGGADLKSWLGLKFRKERPRLEALLGTARDLDDPLGGGIDILARRSKQLAPVFARLKRRLAAGQVTAPLVDLAGSFLHTHVNRMLRSNQRNQELVLFEFLTRLYQSRLARERGPANPAEERRPDE